MLFRSLGARVARLLEWQATPEVQILDFFSSPTPRPDGSGPLRLLSSGCYRQCREAKLSSVSCLEVKKACRHFSDVFISLESRNSVVVVASSLRAGRSGFRIPVGARDSSPERLDRPWGPRGILFFPGIKRPGPEVGQSPTSNAEGKDEWRHRPAVP
jgi:hypothetical protein